jgi:heavy metal sensor kinase
LTLWYGASIAVLFTAFALFLVVLVKKQVFARIDAGLREEVREVSLEFELATNESELVTAATARFAHHAYFEFLVIDSQGETVFASPDLQSESTAALLRRANTVDARFFTLEIADLGPSRVARGEVESEFGRFSVFVMQPLQPIFADLRTLQLTMLGLLPIGILVSLAVGHFLTIRALSPVQKVVDAANAIDISCLNHRIEVVNSGDEIGKLASALNSLIDRLESAVSEIRRFTADASHEIRTPIATLRTEAESALQTSRTVDEYRDSLVIIAEEAARLSRLTDQLLHLSRYDAGIVLQIKDNVRLDALLLDVIDQLRPVAAARGIQLVLRSHDDGEVLGDDILLSQALYNVIENGIKYSPQGTDVAIALRVDEGLAAIEVDDSGIGISEEHTRRVFERFYRADHSQQAEAGAGLGLAIARSAIEAHQGTISLQSELGVGTTITITLPIIQSKSYSKTSI